MPTRHQSRDADGGADLDLPPGYTVLTLRESGNAFAYAQDIAGRDGAGTLVWTRRFDTVEFALVLEPEQALLDARRVVYAIMCAVGDAIGSHCLPERQLAFNWPDTILIDGGIVGGVQLAWPPGCHDTVAPDWLVAGVTIRAVVNLKRDLAKTLERGRMELGAQFDQAQTCGTSLEAEGFDLMDQGQLIGSFCRHFLVYLDLWNERGFSPIGQSFLGRLPEHRGATRGIDGNGDLVIQNRAGASVQDRRTLVPALAVPQWLDPATQEPWL